MTKIILLTFTTIALAASVTSAQPSLTEPSPEPTPAHPGDGYLSVGGMLGGNDTKLTAAISIETARRLADSAVFLHAMGAFGSADELFGSGSGSFGQGRLGLEVRGCTPGGGACIYTGLDAGVQHVYWSGVEGFFAEPGDPMTTYDSTRFIAVPRIGLDVGGKVVRFRPGLDLVMGGDGVDGANVNMALAVQW